jgi:membrane protease YdiL (CAAX protease family)
VTTNNRRPRPEQNAQNNTAGQNTQTDNQNNAAGQNNATAQNNPAQQTTLEKYFHESRGPVYTSLFVIPLFLTYELSSLVLTSFYQSSFRNGADILLRNAIALFGLDKFPFLILIYMTIIAVIAGFYKNRQGISVSSTFFFLMLVESFVLAIIFKALIFNTTWVFFSGAALLALSSVPASGPGYLEELMLSLGAGLYEELVFRLLLLGSLLHIGRFFSGREKHKWFNIRTLSSLLISSLLFAAFHYHPALGGHEFDIYSFVFRWIGGIYLSFIFLLRGFGISAWTHAFFDIFVVNSWF